MISELKPNEGNPWAFAKYHGAGNDFIMVDNRRKIFPINNVSLIVAMCRRHSGIGADGLICIETDESSAFYMRYFNADGQVGSFCGNGARCAVMYASQLGIWPHREMSFRAFDGHHRAFLDRENNTVKVEMHIMERPRPVLNGYFADTGSPHFVVKVDQPSTVDVMAEGKHYRHHTVFQPGGVNVNFVSVDHNGLQIRTFERGVENETLACGTGVVAAALVACEAGWWKDAAKVPVKAMGGMLYVDASGNHPLLTGKAVRVFEGLWVPGQES